MTVGYSTFLQCVVFDDSPIQSVKDLAGKRVNVGSPGQSQYLLAQTILEAAGLSFDDLAEANNLSIADACEEMKNGNLDAIIVGNTPLTAIAEMSTFKPIRMLEIGQDVLDNACEILPCLINQVVPAEDTYECITEDYNTLYAYGCIVVSAETDEELVYEMVKAYCENYEELRAVVPTLPEDVSETYTEIPGTPFHPGALRYYQEQGWV